MTLDETPDLKTREELDLFTNLFKLDESLTSCIEKLSLGERVLSAIVPAIESVYKTRIKAAQAYTHNCIIANKVRSVQDRFKKYQELLKAT